MKYLDHLTKKIPSSPRGYGDECLIIHALRGKIVMLDHFLENLQASVPESQPDLAALKESLVWLVRYYEGAAATDEEHTIYSEFAWNNLSRLDREIEELQTN